MEHSEAANKPKDLMIAKTSHELKTPLNSIIGMIDLIEEFVSEEGQEYLQVA
jgi:signal transduction histidine kinase